MQLVDDSMERVDGGARRFPAARLAVSLAVAAAAAWVVFRGADPHDMAAAARGLRPGWLALALASMLALLALRLVRWWLLVRPLGSVSAARAVRLGAVGLMAIDLLPLRLGELARPVLLDRRAGVHFGAGVAAVLVERVLDVGALLLILLAAFATAELPAQVAGPGGWAVDLDQGRRILLVAVPVLLVPVVAAVVAGERLLPLAALLLRPLPSRLRDPVIGGTASFASASRLIGRPSALMAPAVLSLLGWTASALVAWSLLRALDLGLGLPEAAVVMLVVAVALLLPSPAGGLGVFEAGAVVGLAAWSIPASTSAIFALLLHATHVGTISAVGLACAWTEGLGLRDLRGEVRRDPGRSEM